jgi:predicted permease
MYRWLLRLYPASFRNEYGREMTAVFARERRDTPTALGMAALWLRVIADTCVNAARIHWDILTQDLRYTLRTLRRTPAFALTAVSVVALGIGATTAAFSLADFVLIRPLPFPEADRLVLVSEQRPGLPRTELAPANYRDLKQMATSFEALGAYRGLSLNLVGARQALRLQGAAMTADVLAALAVRPTIGRRFTAADDADGAPATALVSYALWQQEFGGDASIVGRTVRLDGEVYTVIGVMPRDFNFPGRGAQLWTAMRFVPADFVDRRNSFLQGIGRLRRDVSVDAARTEMSMLAGRLQQQYPKENEQTGASVIRLRDGVSQQSRTLLVTLFGAAACVLLIACANLTNLLLARAIDRRREMAVRIALGAGRERVLRQLLTESLVVTATGGVLGLALAAATVPILSRLVPTALPIAEIPSMDVRVVAFTIALTMVTGIGFGIVPLLQHHRDRASEGLREGAALWLSPRSPLRSSCS